MNTSLGNLFKFAYHKLDQFILGDILAYIALVSTTTITLFNSGTTNQIFDITSALNYDLDSRVYLSVKNNFSILLANSTYQNQRPNYKELLENPFVQQAKESQQTEYIVAYLSDIINSLQLNMDKSKRYYYNLSSTFR
ncbi:unnamed protein product [Rotaria sp. Silwood1]|nr:unnamed protein product [Rotaria sp. Silwood1]